MFFKLGLRNVFRNKRRTIITELAIVIGVVAIVFLGGVLSGMNKSWSDNLIAVMSGHLSVIRADYFENLKNRPLKMTLKDTGRYYEILDSQKEVEACVARLDISGMIGTGEESTTFFGYGLDLARQVAALPKAFDTVFEGQGLEPGDNIGAVVGVGLAKSLNKGIGDSLLIATNTIYGQLNAIEVVIRGLSKTGEAALDDNMVIISLIAAQELLDMPGRASEINILLKPGIKLDESQTKLIESMQLLNRRTTVKTWRDMNPMFAQVNNMFAGIGFIVSLIIFIIVAAGVANTMLMSVFERVREIGTIAAIGTEPRQITRLFLFEGLSIGVLGAGLGLLIGITLTLVVAQFGIPLRFPGATEAYTIYPAIQMKNIIGAVVLVLLMSLIAAIVPAHYASRLDPVKALR